jgi:hypothetical protein
MRLHETQEKGRTEILSNYHLRVCQVTRDTRLPDGYVLLEQRLDETEIGKGTTVTLIDAKRSSARIKDTDPDEVAGWPGLLPDTAGLVGWDVFDAVLTPGEIILLLSWKDTADAQAFEDAASLPGWCAASRRPRGARLRHVRSKGSATILPRRQRCPNGSFMKMDMFVRPPSDHVRSGGLGFRSVSRRQKRCRPARGIRHERQIPIGRHAVLARGVLS